MRFVGPAWIACLVASTVIGAAVPGAEPEAESEAPAADSSEALPPTECVRMLREARIALDSRDGALQSEGRRLLRAAAEAFPREWVPILELWNHHRGTPLPAAEAAKLRELLTRRLTDPESRIPSGMLEYLVHNPDAGDDELRLVLRSASSRLAQSPQDRDLLGAVAGLQGRLGLVAESRVTLGRLLALLSGAAADELRWRCIDLDIELEHWADAFALLEPLMKRDPVPPLARIVSILALGKLGRHEALTRELSRLEADDQILRETIVEILLHAAWDLRDFGHDEQAERYFRRVLESNPEHREAQRAVFHLYSTEEERRAQQALLDETWQGESDALLLLDRGTNLLAAGDSTRAWPLLERAARGLPDSENAWFNLGLCAVQLERWQQAVDTLSRAVKINPRRAEAFFNRGAALAKLDRCKEALVDLERALFLQPDLKNAHYYLFVCHRSLGDDEAALREYRLYSRSP